MDQILRVPSVVADTAVPAFIEFKKIPRLSRDMIVTEKIDGTNAQILVPENLTDPLLAGSRTRWLTPGKHTDNFGFAAWVLEHEAELRLLGPGRHYGEWFGKGIQRGYGLDRKRFALFNVAQWFDLRAAQDPLGLTEAVACPECCTVVPALYAGTFDTGITDAAIENLKTFGSKAVPGWMQPEGIVVFHVAAGQYFKKTVEGDEKPKGQVS